MFWRSGEVNFRSLFFRSDSPQGVSFLFFWVCLTDSRFLVLRFSCFLSIFLGDSSIARWIFKLFLFKNGSRLFALGVLLGFNGQGANK
jgi:hypothetical protein